MMSTDRPVEVDRYLKRLDNALAGVPPHTADDIRAGVEEELSSLDPDAARVVRLAERDQRRYRGRDARARVDAREQSLLHEARMNPQLGAQQVAQIDSHRPVILRRRSARRLGGRRRISARAIACARPRAPL